MDQIAMFGQASGKKRKPAEEKVTTLQVLSYGAGTQTFSMLVLIEQGILPRPDMVIFADLENERPETYTHLHDVAIPLMGKLALPFVHLRTGNIYLDSVAKKRTPRPPQCTKMYKIERINAYVKPLLGVGERAEVWIGITTDEEERSKSKSDVSYMTKRYPLMEIGYSRDDCIAAIIGGGYSLPGKSGCWFCPWRSTSEWYAMRRDDPDRFKLAKFLETNSGHKLPMYGRSLLELDSQKELSFESDDDPACVEGYCFA